MEREEEDVGDEQEEDEIEHQEDTDKLTTGRSTKKETVPGIIYLSKIPPYMKPLKMRAIFSQFGEIGRLFLQPEDQSRRKKRKKMGGTGKKNFTEGWIEFKDKKVAKSVARSLNNTPVGGKKRSFYCEDIWNIKYLPKFRWTHISEKLAYEKASREQRMRTEIAQARKETNVYLENVSRNKGIQAMEEKRKKKARKIGKVEEQKAVDISVVKWKYRQKDVVVDEPETKKRKTDDTSDSMQEKPKKLNKSLLLKVFGN